MRPRALLLIGLLTLGPALPLAADQRLSDLLLQVQRLQEEVQQLRGRIEVQQYELSVLKRQQKEQFMDLDARLQGLAASGPRAGGGNSARPALSGTGAGFPSEEKQAYRNAFDLLKQRRYDEAILAFEDLLRRYPRGEFSDNAHYWLGEASYVKQDYGTALGEFQRVLANYPLSPKVPASLLKIGYIHYDQGDWQGARTSLQDVADKFPDSAEARLALSRLERMAHEGH